MMQKICDVEELAGGSILGRKVDGKKLALVKIKEQIFAFDDECTHEHYPLRTGILEVKDEEVSLECIHHGTRFDLRTGKVLALPATRPLKVYKTEVKQGEVWVDV